MLVNKVWRCGTTARIGMCFLFLSAFFMTGASWAASSTPTISGAITGGEKPAFGVPQDIYDYGYTAEEYLMEGSSVSYAPTDSGVTSLDSSGMWSINATQDSTPYRTRLLVIRPTDPAKFNGTIYVEWLNVSAGFDLTPDLSYGRKELLKAGYIYVGVDAQSVGVNNPATGLKAYAPERYDALNVPTDDKFSYDIFAQAGQAIKNPQGVNPFSKYDVEHIIAGGESQSAARMVTYINAVHPIVNDGYEGFLVHSRGRPAELNDDVTAPLSTTIRADLTSPVMEVQTETDVIRAVSSRQADSPIFRLWELTGTAHLDAHAEQDLIELTDKYLPSYPNPICKFPTDNSPERYFIDAAIYHLNRWVAESAVPPHASFMEILNGEYVRDDNGNVIGGLRLPQLDVPIARYSGTGNTAAPEDGPTGAFCFLYGTVTPFDQAAINDLYPSHEDYVQQIETSVASLEQNGFLRPYDAEETIQTARNSDIGSISSPSDNEENDDHHGGGCTLVLGGPFDPGFPILIALSVLILGWRRARRYD